MTITELIKEGEEFRDSIGDSTHGIGKIQDSSKFYLWVERVVRYLGQTVPKDISIERFMHYSNQINPIHCSKSSFEGLLNILRAVEELPDVVTADDLVHRKKDDDKINHPVRHASQSRQLAHSGAPLQTTGDYLITLLLVHFLHLDRVRNAINIQ